MRTHRKSVRLAEPFTLKGVGEQLPPGTYEIVTDEEQIPSILFTAWRRTQTRLRLPSLERDIGLEQYVTIDPQELDNVLKSQTAAGHAASNIGPL